MNLALRRHKYHRHPGELVQATPAFCHWSSSPDTLQPAKIITSRRDAARTRKHPGQTVFALIRHTATLLLLCAAMCPKVAVAGSNAAGKAYLTWDPHQIVTDLQVPPSAGTPLYLKLVDVEDVASVAVTLEWSPNNLLGPCYYLQSSPPGLSTGCGGMTYRSSPTSFNGDSGYTADITFPSGTDHTCIAYLFGGDYCQSLPATFCLTSVQVTDAVGMLDQLSVVGNATAFGGDSCGCSTEADGVFPINIVSGRSNTLYVHGDNIAAATGISVRNAATTIAATSVTLHTPNALKATVPIPADFTGPSDIIITSNAYPETLFSALHVSADDSSPRLVWQVRLHDLGDSVWTELIGTLFQSGAYPNACPLTTIPVRRVRAHVDRSDGRLAFGWDISIAQLPISSSGAIDSPALSFVPEQFVSISASGLAVQAVVPDELRTNISVPGSLTTVSLDAAGLSGPIRSVDYARPAKWLVVHTDSTTEVYNDNAKHVRSLPIRSYQGAFSRDHSRYVAIGRFADESTSWLVMDAVGRITQSGPRTHDGIAQLHLHPDGKTITFDNLKGGIVVAADIESATELTVALPNGIRYYSEDGRRVAIVNALPSRVQVFDVSDPTQPIAISSRAFGDTAICTAALSYDGEVVALQFEENRMGHTRVAAYSADFGRQASLGDHILARGLHFVGNYLLVGMQLHPIPIYLRIIATNDVMLYDVSAL